MGRGVRVWQAGLFAAGIMALIASLVWPLDALGDSLFAAHMGQHIVVMGLAGPLLVLGRPLPTMMRALPPRWQRRLAALAASASWRRVWVWISATGVATTLQLIGFAPRALYDSYGSRAAPWGFSLLEDQQMADVLMMTAGSMMYLLATVILLAAWFVAMERPHRAARHRATFAHPDRLAGS